MAVYLPEEGSYYTFAVNNPMFPSICHPATKLKPDYLNKSFFRKFFAKFGM